jgi:hypothetical protein
MTLLEQLEAGMRAGAVLLFLLWAGWNVVIFRCLSRSEAPSDEVRKREDKISLFFMAAMIGSSVSVAVLIIAASVLSTVY